MSNELQGFLALLAICAPLMAYSLYLKLRIDKLNRLIAAEEENERLIAAQKEKQKDRLAAATAARDRRPTRGPMRRT
ncbi:hypothetical protein ER13_08595 [Brevundimonas sp. EAKA]|uniref:hypothetical protein n=1 Tax=Brevundimonas sp. EAKA TaxID=1495854 RepID=UPI0004A90869|nr:hypothetical protein [Brevundimonas sp. EAKA]KDP94908.1 hypothetical protein ER13_08595 [Brevundimonas sp. EAKA]